MLLSDRRHRGLIYVDTWTYGGVVEVFRLWNFNRVPFGRITELLSFLLRGTILVDAWRARWRCWDVSILYTNFEQGGCPLYSCKLSVKRTHMGIDSNKREVVDWSRYRPRRVPHGIGMMGQRGRQRVGQQWTRVHSVETSPRSQTQLFRSWSEISFTSYRALGPILLHVFSINKLRANTKNWYQYLGFFRVIKTQIFISPRFGNLNDVRKSLSETSMRWQRSRVLEWRRVINSAVGPRLFFYDRLCCSSRHRFMRQRE